LTETKAERKKGIHHQTHLPIISATAANVYDT
jgi:hypothetical protein